MIMVGISTLQNITNCIPAVHQELGITQFILLESKTAHHKNWSQGLASVLESRKISVSIVDISSVESDIPALQTLIENALPASKTPVIWNMGGGLKQQQIALWEIFRKRSGEQSLEDKVCYANQDRRGTLQFWTSKNGVLTSFDSPICVDLSAEEIFKVFGYTMIKGSSLILNKIGGYNTKEIPSDYLHLPEFREFLMRLPVETFDAREKEITLNDIYKVLVENKRFLLSHLYSFLSEFPENELPQWKKNKSEEFKNNKISAIINKLNLRKNIYDTLLEDLEVPLIPLSDKTSQALEMTELPVRVLSMKKITQNRHEKSATYFEEALCSRILSILEKNENSIIEVRANVRFESLTNPGTMVSEYDILCVTNTGVIITLDAKTFGVDKKDMDARLYNLKQSSGIYSQFSIILPLDFDDVEKKWMPKEVLRLPFKLHKMGMPFFVVSSSIPEFWLKEEKGEIQRSASKPDDSSWVHCRAFANLI